MKCLILISLIGISYGLPGGAPYCADKPGHFGTSPQTGPSGVTATTDIAEDGSVLITVSADPPFKGILITGTAASGQFIVPAGQPLHTMTLCKGITHESSELKSEVSAIFVKDDPTENAEFNLIIVRDFTTYWTDIQFS
ncbi:uncharacterized protein LOC111713186 [Eurytemora carolleeae]|uniref:uncharacterized protein LOC111713186 n=1 Tax=Eurytemora carolleeae TaxID=1294199 RepID=UPI000C78C4B2|nr:uncharacterized protein LOC111713186 [Eurytemora carolleeae]|eukprot:XP_023343776.1 uncharacterized protein LOC111713186 [Eurytemora affinis]